MYAYAGNGYNPINSFDSDGLATLQIGWAGSAAAGVGGSVGKGFVVGFSLESGFQFGTYTTIGKGIYAGAGVALNLDVTVSANKDVKDLAGKGIAIGGSVTVGASGVAGVEVTDPQTEGASKSITISGGAGAGTPEVHNIETETEIDIAVGKGSTEPGTTVETGSKGGATPSDITRTITVIPESQSKKGTSSSTQKDLEKIFKGGGSS